MKYPTENDVQKLGGIIRTFAAFIFVCGIVAAIGLCFAIITEPFDPLALVGGVVILVVLHISGSIAFKGFAPKYLLFAHGPKENI